MGQHESRSAWFKAGYWFSKDDERGANEGLSRREIKALQEENSRPWGQSWWASDAVKGRASEAQNGRER